MRTSDTNMHMPRQCGVEHGRKCSDTMRWVSVDLKAGPCMHTLWSRNARLHGQASVLWPDNKCRVFSPRFHHRGRPKPGHCGPAGAQRRLPAWACGPTGSWCGTCHLLDTDQSSNTHSARQLGVCLGQVEVLTETAMPWRIGQREISQEAGCRCTVRLRWDSTGHQPAAGGAAPPSLAAAKCDALCCKRNVALSYFQ